MFRPFAFAFVSSCVLAAASSPAHAFSQQAGRKGEGTPIDWTFRKMTWDAPVKAGASR